MTALDRTKINLQDEQAKNKYFITGLFKDRASFEKAYQFTIDQGYNPDEVNILMSEESRKRHFLDDSQVTTLTGDKSMEGLAVGGALGATIIGISTAIAAIGTAVALPGLGIIVVGPLAAGLVGAGIGSITGGLLGALIGWGIPEERVVEYEKGIKAGGIVMTVSPHSKEDARIISEEWDKYNSDYNINQ